jgi:hypothetical protein
MKFGKFEIRYNEPKGETRIEAKSIRNLPSYWNETIRTSANMKIWRIIYEQGGIYAQAVDLYWLYMLTQCTFVGENEKQIKFIEDFFNAVNMSAVLREMIIDARVFGDGFAELLFGQGRLALIPVGIKSVPSDSMWIDLDGYGRLLGYTQKFNEDGVGVPINPSTIVHLQLDHMAGGTYGQSVIKRAYDEIMADTKTRESTSAGIERHGFPKFKVMVDTVKKAISAAEKTAIDETFKDVAANNEFILYGPIDIQTIDTGGAPNVKEYNDTMVSRVCAAMGVPEELLGLRQGSTDATAVSRIDAFYKQVETYQCVLEDLINKQIIDRIIGIPGAVRVEFADVSPKDEAQIATMIKTVTSSTPMDPWSVVSPQWCQQRLGIDPAVHQKDILEMIDMPTMEPEEEEEEGVSELPPEEEEEDEMM